MAKITGFLQKVFGQDATNIGQVGSAAAGTKVTTSDPDTIQALTAFTNGISDVTLSSKRIIPQEEFMALHYLHTLQNAYQQQEGIQEYNSDVTYFTNSIVKKSGTYELYGSLVDDNIGNALTDQTKWAMIANFGTFPTITGNVRNAKMSVTTDSSSATFTADEVIVSSALAGRSYKLPSYNKTINLATTGAGGMDTGSAPTSGYVALYAIYNPNAGTSSILAQNATASAATEVYSGSYMPSGYTASSLIGVWPTTAGGLFVVGYQKDRSVFFASKNLITTTTQNASLTSLNISGAVPKNANTISGYGICNGSTVASNNNFSVSGSSTGIGYNVSGNNNSGVETPFHNIPLITQQTIYYQDTTTAASISEFSLYATSYTF